MATITGVLARPTGYAGIWGWITTVDHKRIGVLYGVTAFIMLLIAGSEAGIMRAQLAQPDNTLVGPETFNRLFTMHAFDGPNEVRRHALRHLLALLADGKISPPIHARFPLEEAAEAHALMESRTIVGNIVLKP